MSPTTVWVTQCLSAPHLEGIHPMLPCVKHTNREVVPCTRQWLLKKLNAMETLEADLAEVVVKAKVRVLDRLLKWCCWTSSVAGSCTC